MLIGVLIYLLIGLIITIVMWYTVPYFSSCDKKEVCYMILFYPLLFTIPLIVDFRYSINRKKEKRALIKEYKKTGEWETIKSQLIYNKNNNKQKARMLKSKS